MKILLFSTLCFFTFGVRGAPQTWKEEFSGDPSVETFEPGRLKFYSDSSAVKTENGVLRIVSRSGSAKGYLTAKIANGDYALSFDVLPLEDADSGYGRSVFCQGKTGALWLIEIKGKGGVYFYTSDSAARRGWAVRSHTKINMGHWYRIRLVNEADRCAVTIHERDTDKRIWQSRARHNVDGWGTIAFQASGKPMGMLIDNIELTYDDEQIRLMDTPPGMVRLVDPWAPAGAITRFVRIVAARPKGVEKDPLRCWMADIGNRDGNTSVMNTPFTRKGDFHWRIENGKVLFANGLSGFMIKQNSLWSLYDFGAKMECISKGKTDIPLWRVKVSSSDGKRTEIVEPGNRPDARIDGDGERLTVRLGWKSQRAAKLSGSVDVNVTITLARGDSVARWRIEVTNHIEDGGLWKISFPVIGGLGYSGESDVCSQNVRNAHGGFGDLIRKCDGPLSHRYQGKLVPTKYPGGSIQLLSISCGPQTTVYLATEDGRGYYKGWLGNMDDNIELFAYPGGMAQPGTDYRQSYDTVLGPMRGDWFDAAKRYRAWALKQAWCRKGPIAGRNDIPERFKKCDIVLRTSLWHDPKGETWNKAKAVWEISDEGRAWRDACGRLTSESASMVGCSPVGQIEKQVEMYRTEGSFVPVHTYMWHQNLFDDMYPDFLPAIKGFKALVSDWQSRNILVMPYINGWILDKRVPWFDEAKPYLARNFDGGTYDFRTRRNTSPATTPCVYTTFWQDRIAHLANVICGDLGCDALYIDQSATMPPVLCFDKRHGHPLGGSNWFAAGQRKLFEKVRRAAGKPIYLSSEGFCEIYMDLVDDFLLIWGTHSPNNVPLVPAIYGGYTNWHGTRIANRDNRTASLVVFGRALLWGEKFGHIICLNDVVHNVQSYIQGLLRLRARIRRFVQFGEMLRPPAITSKVPDIAIERWDTEQKGVLKVMAPGVERSLWRAADGTLGLIVVNYRNKPQQVEFDSRFVEGNVAPFRIIGRDGMVSAGKLEKGRALSLVVPAEQAVAVEILPRH